MDVKKGLIDQDRTAVVTGMKVAVFEATEWKHEACLRLQAHHTVDCTAERLTADAVERFSDAQVVTPSSGPT